MMTTMTTAAAVAPLTRHHHHHRHHGRPETLPVSRHATRTTTAYDDGNNGSSSSRSDGNDDGDISAAVHPPLLSVLFLGVKWPDPDENASGARSLTLLHGILYNYFRRVVMMTTTTTTNKKEGQRIRLTIVTPRRRGKTWNGVPFDEARVRQLLSRMTRNTCAVQQQLDLEDMMDSVDIHMHSVDPNHHFYHCKGGGSHADPLQQAMSCSDSSTADLSSVASAFPPDVVLFDTFVAQELYGWRVEELWPDAVRLLDYQDYHALRLHRQSIVQDWMHERDGDHERQWSFDSELILERVKDAIPPPVSQCMQRELAALYRCDLGLIISQFEYMVLTERMRHVLPGMDGSRLLYVPFVGMNHVAQSGVDVAAVQRPFSDRQHLVMIGSFRHEGNVDSLKVMRYAVWPKLHKRLQRYSHHPSRVRLDVYGSYPTREVLELTDEKTGFMVRGQAKTIDVLGEYRLAVAPLRFGAGLKGKVVDAWHNGTPLVTTSIGAEGMTMASSFKNAGGALSSELQLPAGEIADDVDAFVDKCEQLYMDERLWTSKAQQCADGLGLFHGGYMEEMTRRLVELLARDPHTGRRFHLEALRQGDYIRCMLGRGVSSTDGNKYRSMYIAQKAMARAATAKESEGKEL